MTRTEFLRKNTIESVHKQARIAMDPAWTTSYMDLSLPERKAYAIKMILDNMPLYIGEQELIVGSRTIYGHRSEDNNKSDMNYFAMPSYVNQKDIDEFGFNEQFSTKGHYTAGYEKILRLGIDGIIDQAKKQISQESLDDKINFLKSVIIAYEGLSNLIKRYSDYANQLAQKENGTRKDELLKISEVCRNISTNPPTDFYEASQLFWFSHLSLLIENFQFMNYGRVDQFLYPFLHTVSEDKAQQLIDYLLLKMYDGVDLKDNYLGTYAAQHNLTIGGVKPDGSNAVNRVSFMILDAVERIRLPEPQISIRINSKNPPEFLSKACELSVKGLNFIAYYNDDLFIKSMINTGLPDEEANNYSFDLCQDITIAGRGDFYCSAYIHLASILLDLLKKCDYSITFEEFIAQYKNAVAENIRISIEHYNKWEASIREYNKGNKEYFLGKVKTGEISPSFAGQSVMSPLPLTSALFDGCIENAVDIARCGCIIEDKGCIIMQLVVAINSISAIRKLVFDEKVYTLSQINQACLSNYDGFEEMRQRLWNSPKWGNDDDYVDLIAKDIIEFACDEMLKYRTPTGARHLAGIHQPHPVGGGRDLHATPEGRKAGTPIPVTLSPENGTMQNGPTAAFKSCAKIDHMKYQWNNCLMLQYFSSSFGTKDGAKKFENLLKSYFKIGGTQHQPNVINVTDLKAAQNEPDKYKDLVVRMWGVSAHFVDLPRDLQDEFISRFEGIA